MRRMLMLFALLAAFAVAVAPGIAPGVAEARAGLSSSFGSRGSRTFSAPSITRITPYGAQPMQRSTTPYPASPGLGGYGNGRSSFASGLLGGLIGAGIGGLLFGRGFFTGGMGLGGFFGFLLQIFLIVMLVRFLLRLLRAPRTAPGMAGQPMMGQPMMGQPMMMGGGMPAGGAFVAPAPLSIGPADYQAFEMILQQVQDAWSRQDLNALRALATPEMLGYFADQLAGLSSRGLTNTVSDVRLEKGDLAEAWEENGQDYATVAMRFSMLDATRDGAGRVVEGSLTTRGLITEIWTFFRVPGGRWLLSAIQQPR